MAMTGSGDVVVAAGQCSVDEPDVTMRVAHQLLAGGATMLRGGAYKPRTKPTSFQGRGKEALATLARAKEETGLPIVTELLDVRDLADVLEVADMIQVGARNMQNTGMLKTLGQVDCPVLLKRAFSATIDETVAAAEYIWRGGNERVILCERGIRTFEPAYRFTLDLAAVPILQKRSGLPVWVDPSHAPGRRDLVLRLSLAAIAVGADGLIVEVDEDPPTARSDPDQQLYSADFAIYLGKVRGLVEAMGRRIA
jgi:3-deoxy-7-phosphoheptulonate synthase